MVTLKGSGTPLCGCMHEHTHRQTHMHVHTHTHTHINAINKSTVEVHYQGFIALKQTLVHIHTIRQGERKQA